MSGGYRNSGGSGGYRNSGDGAYRGGGWNPPRKQPGGRNGNGNGGGGGSDRQYYQEPQRQQQMMRDASQMSGGSRSSGSGYSGGGHGAPPPREPQRFFVPPPQAQQQGRSGGSGSSQAKELTAPPPYLPATKVQHRRGVCSIWTIDVERGRKAYRYDVDIERLPMPKKNGEMDKGRSLVKGADDGQRALHRNLCVELLTATFKKTRRFGMAKGDELVYDNKACLYASRPISDVDIVLENHEVEEYVKVYCGDGPDVRFKVRITRNQAYPELALDDFEQYCSGQSVFNEDRSLRTFFEMATSQFCMNKGYYVSIGPGRLFEVHEPDNHSFPKAFREKVENGIVLRRGLAKGVRVVQGDSNVPTAAVVLDTKVAAFFEAQPLIDTVFDMLPRRPNPNPSMNEFSPGDWAHVERMLQDVRVEVGYRRVRTFELGKLTTKPIRHMTIELDPVDGRPAETISVPEYFRRRWNIELKYLDLPGISPNNPVPAGKKVEVFPLEVLEVMDDQRVPREKTDPKLMDKLLAHNSMPPNDRMREIHKRADGIGLFKDNRVLKAFGISIDQKSNMVTIGVRQLPRLRFHQDKIACPNAQKGDWRYDARQAKYLSTDELHNWIVLCARHKEGIVQDFVGRLVQMGQEKARNWIAVPEIVPFEGDENSDLQWMKVFERCVSNGVQYVMLVDEKRRDTHGLLKLMEALHKVTTQHVTLEKAFDVVKKNQRETLSNILNKLNMKNFGLNYQPIVEPCGKRFALESGDVLVIGYDVAHPAPMSGQMRRMLAAQGESQLSSLDPSCVGICANMTEYPHNFVGDYFFQQSRREALDQLQLAERMAWILSNLDKHRPEHSRPRYIFVIRDGLSEGQFAMACKEELVALKEGCHKFDPNYAPKFVMVIGTKRHSKKFFLEDDARADNLLPGSVIDDRVTRADITEFFLQPHMPIKGTGKPVEYALLEDEIGVSMDELQSLIMALSYSHQIVNLPVSMPEPVYQAHELAKRGKNNFAALKRFKPKNVPKREHQIVAKKGAKRQAVPIIDYNAVNEMLCYWGSGFVPSRFTA